MVADTVVVIAKILLVPGLVIIRALKRLKMQSLTGVRPAVAGVPVVVSSN